MKKFIKNIKLLPFLIFLGVTLVFSVGGIWISKEYESAQVLVYSDSLSSESGDSESLNSVYDPRGQSFITEVKNQGNLGMCWAYSIIDNIEINLKKNFNADGKFDDINLSERDFAYFVKNSIDEDTESSTYLDGTASGLGGNALYNYIYNGGGDFLSAIQSAISNIGLISQDYIENTSSLTGYTNNFPQDMDSRRDSSVKVVGFEHFSVEDIDYQAGVKNAILTYGSVLGSSKMDSTDTYVRDSFNTASDGSYNYFIPKGIYSAIDHMVVIVGWDDNYSKDNFSSKVGHTKPENDGAWLVKNSWGSSWGDGGFVWISYEDLGFDLTGFYSIEIEENIESELLYQYDLGFTKQLYFGEGYSITAGNVYYNALSDQMLDAVGYYIIENGSLNKSGENISSLQSVRVEIYVSDKKMTSPVDGTLVEAFDGESGVYLSYKVESLPENANVTIKKGQYFSVVLTYSSEGVPLLPVEGLSGLTNYWSSNAKEGCSFVWHGVNWLNAKENAKTQGWFDASTGKALTGNEKNTTFKCNNVCIKAYATSLDCEHEYEETGHIDGDCCHYGKIVKTCKKCNKVITVDDEAGGFGDHKYSHKEYSGTCKTKSYTTDWYCCICGQDFAVKNGEDRRVFGAFGDHLYEYDCILEGDCKHHPREVEICKYCGLKIEIEKQELGYGLHKYTQKTVDGETIKHCCSVEGCDAYFTENVVESEKILKVSGDYINMQFSEIVKIGEFIFQNDCGKLIFGRSVFSNLNINGSDLIEIFLTKLDNEVFLSTQTFSVKKSITNISVIKIEVKANGKALDEVSGGIQFLPSGVDSISSVGVVYLSSGEDFVENADAIKSLNGKSVVYLSGSTTFTLAEKIEKTKLSTKSIIIISVVLISIVCCGELARRIRKKKKEE